MKYLELSNKFRIFVASKRVVPFVCFFFRVFPMLPTKKHSYLKGLHLPNVIQI